MYICKFVLKNIRFLDTAGIAVGVVVALVLLSCIFIPMCVACIYIYNSKKKARAGTRSPPLLHSTDDVAMVTTEEGGAAAYPAALTPPKAQHAPLPYPSNQPDVPFPDTTLQQAPPPSYTRAAAYPPLSYPVQSDLAPYPQLNPAYATPGPIQGTAGVPYPGPTSTPSVPPENN